MTSSRRGATRFFRPARTKRLAFLTFLYLCTIGAPFPVTAESDVPAATPPTATVQPEATPSPTPFAEPTPSPEPTSAATPDRTARPTRRPKADPTPEETRRPRPRPSRTPRPRPVPAASPSETPEPTAAPVTVPYLITFRAGTTADERRAALRTVGGELDSWIPELRIASVLLRDGSAAEDAAELADDPSVLRVERDRSRDVEAAPADPRYDEQWSLPRIGWDRVHEAGLPTGEALVAILDTGVDADHPDLEGRLLPGISFVEGSVADTDPHGHGTSLTGIVAAATDNDEGIAGIGGSGVRVLPITVLGADGTGQDSDVIEGLVHAADAGADVILLAFSNPGFSAALQAAVDYAWEQGAVIVAANGNDGVTTPTYPAGDRAVIGVSSTDQDDELAEDSNHGAQTFLAAPGVGIPTTSRDGGYGVVSGTSVAAAHVAAVAAILRAADDDATNGTLVGRLGRSTAAAGTREETGNGRLDLVRALGDLGTDEVMPAGVAGAADGGPFVGPYVAAAPGMFANNGDIGSVAAAGSASYSSGTYTVNGSGADIYGTTDEFHFVYTQFTGDGTITARVASITNTSVYAKAGVMFRESLTGTSRHAYMSMTYSADAEFLWRTSVGGTTSSSLSGGGLVAPYWVRLTRTGNVFSAYRSANGSTWTQQGTNQTVSMASTVYVGLAVSAVNDGAINTSTFTNVTMPGLNSAPVVTTTGTSLSYTENATTVIDSGVTVTDSNGGNLASGQVFINTGYVAGQDVLGFTNQNGISGSYSGGILTLTGTASVANWQTALRSVTYQNTSDAPNTGNRQIAFQVNDGDADSNFGFRTITISSVNDAPVNSVPGTQSTYPDTAKVFSSANGNLISISDDATSGSQQVQLTGTNGAITLSGTTGLTFSVGDGTSDATMTFTGTVANVNTALAGLSFLPSGGFTGTATLQIVTNDQGNTGSGGALSDTDSVSITVAPPDYGIFTTSQDIGAVGFAGGATHSGGTYTVDGGGADIWGTADEFHYIYKQMTGDMRIVARIATQENNDAFAKAGPMFRESLNANSKYAMAIMTPTSGANFAYRTTTGGSAAESAYTTGIAAPYWLRLTRIGDQFMAERSTNGTTWTQTGAVQTISMVATIYVGLAVTAREDTVVNTSTFDNVSADAATLGIFSGRQDVGATLGSSWYDSPTAAAYNVQGAGTGITTATTDQFHFLYTTMTGDGTLTANVASMNNTACAGTGKVGVMLRDSLATNSPYIMASQNESSTTGAQQHYRLTAGATAVLGGSVGSVATPEYYRVTRAGSSFTTERSTNGSTWSAISTARTITMGATIYVGIAVTSSTAGCLNLAVLDNVSLALANQPPVLAASGGTTAHSENVAVVVDSGITVTDADDTNLESGQVFINTGYVAGQDVLGFTDQNGISGSYSGGILTLTGTATVAQWQTALRSVTYNNTSDAPNTGNRQIGFEVNDGTADSNVGFRTVSVAAVNDAPVNSVPGAQSTLKNTAEVFSTANGNLISVIDADAASSSVQVQVTGTNGTVTLSGTTGLTFSVGDGTADATMTFTGTIANVDIALAGMSFAPTTDYVGSAASVQIVTNDQGNSGSGGALSDTDTVSITVVDLGIFSANSDIGAVAAAGSASHALGAYTVIGSGADIFGTADEFQFISRTMSGDGRLTARVTGQQNTNAFAKAGVMFRDTNAAGSVNAFVTVTPSNGVRWQSRATTNGTSSTNASTASIVTPYWVRLTRTGTTFTSEYSPDGTSWTQLGTSLTLTMGATIDVGLAVTSHVDGTLNTSTFDNVSLNHAPAAVADGYSVNEDGSLTVPTGTGVLANDSDADGNALNAVLVTDVSNGSLTLDANGSFSYTPSANFNGTDSFTYKANDGTLDSNIVTVTITVNSVNDVPSFTKGANQTVAEDPGAQSVTNWATTISPGAPANESSQTVSFLVSNDNNTLFTAQPAVSATGTLTYTPAANANGSTTVTIQVQDNGGTANGGVDTSAAQTFTITVNAVNDAPVNSLPAAQSTARNQQLVLSSTGGNHVSISDVDAGSGTVQLQLTGTNGTITLAQTAGISFSVGDGTSDATMTFTGSVTNVNASLDGMRFTPTTNFTGAASVQIVTNDQGNTGSGGALSDTDSLSITVANLGIFTANQDIGGPTIAGSSSYSIATTVYSVSGSGAGITGTSDQFQFIYVPMTGNGRLTANITALSNPSTVALGGVMMRDSLAANSAFAMAQLTDAGSLTQDQRYRTTAGGTATTGGTITNVGAPEFLRVTRVGSSFTTEGSHDSGATWLALGTPRTITMGSTIYVGLAVTSATNASLNNTTWNNVSLNVAPIAVGDSYSINEDATLAPSSPGVLTNDTDPESGAMTAILVTDVSNGSLTLNSNGSFSYTPSADFNGTDSFTYKANDGIFDSSTVTVTITVNGVNDAPSFTKGSNQSIAEDAGAQTVSGWATAISPGPSGESSQVVDFVLTNDNNALFTAQPAVAANGTLTYTPAANATGSATVTIHLHDDGGTANGGVDASATQQFTITVNAINDAPVNSVPGAQRMVKNGRLTFSTASGTRISLSDDAGANPVQVALTATNGTLTLASLTGLTFSVGDGTSDAAMTFTGTISNVVNALAWVAFDPTTGFAGSASVQIVTSDQGNTGSGGTLTDTDSIAVTVADLGIFTANLDVMTPSVRTASLPVGTNPYGVDTNPTTNRIYVANFNAGTVSVIDGAADTVTGTVTVGVGPMGLAVNSVTNRIYVPNNGVGANGTTVSVIDGATNTVIATIGGMTGPRYVAVNEATNRIYVTNNGGTTVKVIDGATNTVASTITLAGVPIGIAVNPVTNRVYVTYGATPGRLAVYDGATNGLITTITTGNTPWAAAVNANTNKVYVTNFASNTVSVISGASNTVVATMATANWPTGIKLDPVSNRVYVAEFLSDSMAVFDGATDTVLARLATGAGPTDLGVNPATDRIFVGSYTTSAARVFQDGLSFTGTSSYSSPTYTVAGAGTGMVSTSDEFQFLYRTLTGNGRLTARTSSITNTAPGASAGLMMRDTLIAVVPFVMVSNTGAGGNTVRQTHRATFGGASTTATVAGAAVPQYLRITRVGNVFTTEYSADGTSWTQAGAPQTIVMSPTISVGIAVTSETASALNTSTLDSLALNLAPVAVDDPSYTVAEDGTLTQPAAGGVLTNDSDPESAPMTAVLVSGTSGLTLNSDGSFSYVPPADFNGVATFTYKANDGAFDSNTVTATITVGAVNDAPVNSVPGAQFTTLDTSLVFSSGNGNPISIADVDAGSNSVQVQLTGTNGTVTLSGTTGLTFSAGDGTADTTTTFTGTVANINSALAGASFAPTASFSGSASLQVVLNDQGNSGSGGALSDTDTVAITVAASTGFQAEDYVAGSATGAGFTTVSEGTARGGEAITTNGDNLGVAPPAEMVRYLVDFPDAGATNTYHLYVRYRLLADVYEDDSAWALRPVDADPAQATSWDRINNLRDHGDTTYRWVDLASNTTGGLDLVAAYTNVTAGDHTWWFGARENGFYADAFVFSTGFDLDLTAAGQAHLDSVINDRPVVTATGGSLAYSEQSGAQAIDSGLTVTDPDDTSLRSATVTISAGYVNGQDALAFTDQNGITGSWSAATGVLTLTGTSSVANYQTALRTVTYSNGSDAPGASRTVTFRASDGYATSTGATRTIAISQSNDAPVNTVPGAQTTSVDTAKVFSTANGNAISITDVDAGTSAVQVQLDATNGTVTLAGMTGLTFSVGDGTADGTMTFTGTTGAINTALDGLSFIPTTGYTGGGAAVQIVTDDQGNTGSGGALSDTDSVAITVTVTTPTANADAYTVNQDSVLEVAAPGVLANDTGGTLTVAAPRPTSGPSNGLLALNADGSFDYTPNVGFSGTDSFTYKANNGTADSTATTVTITVDDGAYVSSSNWSTTFDSARFLELQFPAYVAPGSTVTGGTFRHTYRSATPGDTTCYFFTVWDGGTLIGTHGSSGSPVSCNATGSYVTDTVSLPELDTVTEANDLGVRIFVWNSGGRKSAHKLATLGVDYYLD